MIPKISVIIPAYNSAPYLTAAVTSALMQEGVETQVCVVDDCSTDETAKLMQQLCAKHDNVTFQRNSINSGAGKTRNAALQAATYSLVAFLDSDDNWESTHLRQLADALNRTPDAPFAYGNYRFFYEKDKTYSRYSKVNARHQFKDQLTTTLIATPCVLIDTAKTGPLKFIPRRTGQDYHLWLTLLGKGVAVGVDSQSVTVTKRDNSLSKSKLQNLQDIYEIQTQYFQISTVSALSNTLSYLKNAAVKRWIFAQ